jgi:hypothetical protein
MRQKYGSLERRSLTMEKRVVSVKMGSDLDAKISLSYPRRQ